MSTLSQILAEKIANKNNEGLLKHPVHMVIIQFSKSNVLLKRNVKQLSKNVYCCLSARTRAYNGA